jgi:hypothetical protein
MCRYRMVGALLVSFASTTMAIASEAGDTDERSGVEARLDVPPTPKRALQLLLRNHDVPLSVDPSCEGVGSDFADTTIGDYISGLLAELTGPMSSVLASCVPAVGSGGNNRNWECDVWLAHASGDTEWRWGVSFNIDGGSGAMIRKSVRCIGMG